MTEFKTMGLKECSFFDNSNGLKQRLTGWGKICKEREGKPFTRKQRALINKPLASANKGTK
jgi:hypothetical protein